MVDFLHDSVGHLFTLNTSLFLTSPSPASPLDSRYSSDSLDRSTGAVLALPGGKSMGQEQEQEQEQEQDTWV